MESIIAHKKQATGMFFLTKWAGYDETSWEHEKNFEENVILSEYKAKCLAGLPPPPAPAVTPLEPLTEAA